ncbi:MAG: hypothetical protein AAGE85_18345 [Pseudomonadota bacterium]
MLRKLILVTAAAALTGAQPAAAQDYDALLTRAIEKITWEYPDNWAYTERRQTRKAVWVGRYDPSADAESPWTLLSVDGRAPTAEETETFLEDKADDEDNSGDGTHEDSGEQSGEDSDEGVGEMITAGSLELVEEDSEHWLFAFTPKGEDEEETRFLEQMHGTLRISKPDGHLEALDIVNEKPVKPKTGVKIRDFKTSLEFGRAFDGGLIVPLSFHFRIKGRAYLAVGFDEMETVEFSDFEPVIE